MVPFLKVYGTLLYVEDGWFKISNLNFKGGGGMTAYHM